MGLREIVQAAAGSVVKAVGNIVVSTNYQSFVSSSYNATTGVMTTTYSTVTGVSVIFDAFRLEQIDGQNIKPEDKLGLVAQVQIPGITPGANDLVSEGTETWNVVKVRVDPAGAMWELQVRKP